VAVGVCNAQQIVFRIVSVLRSVVRGVGNTSQAVGVVIGVGSRLAVLIGSRDAAPAVIVGENTYTYDSFGNTTNSTGSVTNYFRYTAREFDSETGIYYYRSRYYDPSAGRFISEDPTRFDAGVNFYAYVKNNAPNFNDPSGNDPFQHWPLNGNLLPGFKRQDGVCTTGLLANTMNSRPCIKKCCKEHDDCYTMYNCNASSFFNGGFPGPCQICNLEVEACILTADKSTGGAGCRKCSK
jgi:RHS repeat-associated protein